MKTLLDHPITRDKKLLDQQRAFANNPQNQQYRDTVFAEHGINQNS
jgi:hypothetical protein